MHGEEVLRAFNAFDLDPNERLDLQILLYSQVLGLAIHLEREAEAVASTGLSDEQWMDVQGGALGAIAEGGAHPEFAAQLRAFTAQGGYDLDLDKVFELGLRTLLDGLAELLGKRERA
jgi:hypothetical protein